jgi:peptidoglycan hydrolase-like protein with peptidoglycan-binding domain
MKHTLTLLAGILICSTALADDQIREAQQMLKDQGFYFGEITGEMNDDTKGAIHRFQMHNAIDVTDKLDAQTVEAIRSGNDAAPAAPQPESTPEPPAAPQKSFQPGPAESTRRSDHEFLDKTIRGENAPPAIAADMTALFRSTPYERAPRLVQATTVERVQARLRRQGCYHGEVDGVPGPELNRAIRLFQIEAELPATGRLDMATLNLLRMLPGQKYSSFHMTGERTLRGVRVY